MLVWTHAILGVLYACVLYFCICTCSVQLSMFHLKRRSSCKSAQEKEISDHTVGLQHPERVHPPSGSASARWHADLCEDPDWQNHHFESGALKHY